MKRLIRRGDLEGCLLQNTEKAPLIASIVRLGGSLIKLWDGAMHLGTYHTEGLKALSMQDAGTTGPKHVLCVGRTILT